MLATGMLPTDPSVGQHHESRARNACGTLGGQQQHRQYRQLPSQPQGRVGRLRQEHDHGGQVQTGAIEVE
jgi:hypothetical protein